MKQLWNRCEALDPVNIASILFSKEITNAIKKLIKSKYNEKCDDEELRQSLNRLVLEKINPEQVKPYKSSKKEKTPKKEKVANLNSAVEHVIEQIVENTNPDSPLLS